MLYRLMVTLFSCVTLLCACAPTVKTFNWKPLLEGFGFNKPMPDGFVFPGNDGYRTGLPDGVFSVNDYKADIDKNGAVLDFRYKPDQTWFLITRKPKSSRVITFDQYAENWVHIGHDIGESKPNIVDDIADPKISECVINGKAYRCVQVSMAPGEDPRHQVVSAMFAERDLDQYGQYLQVEVFTPGPQINLEATGKLLDTLNL